MPPEVLQPSFASGELSPGLAGRVDLAKYRIGAKTMRNWFSETTGGASTRAGMAAVGRCKWQSMVTPSRIIDFEFSTLQAYALEFGNQYMRVIMDGGYVLEPSFAIGAISQATPGVFTAAGHNFANGDQLFVSGAGGMTAVNSSVGFQLLVTNANTGAGTFSATDLDGNPVNTVTLPAYTGGGVVSRIFTLVTPYAAADLRLIKFTQDADVLTLTHPNYTARELTRTQHWAWTLTAITFQSTVQAPTGCTVTPANPAGDPVLYDFYYVVCSVTDATGEQSVPSGVGGFANAPLNQTNGTANEIQWTAPGAGPAPDRYNIFGASVPHGGAPPTVFGYVGQATGLSFFDTNIAPDFSNTPPAHLNPFAGGVNPATVSFFQSRRAFAAPAADPNTIFTTKTGDFYNMDASSPAKDDDAITASLNSRQVNAIKHLVPMQALLALTSSGAWAISGGSTSDFISPSTFVATPQAYVGCSDVPPITINTDVLYVQAKQSAVRDLAYNFYVNIFTGDDKSVLSRHLLQGRQIVEWAYAEEPFKIIWAIRDDGILLGFTFLKEQDVYAWHRHDTAGLFNSVCSISEGQEDAVYFVVTRSIPGVNGGKPLQYVERMASRYMGGNSALSIPSDPALGWFLDCALRYGPNPIAATLTPAASTGTKNITSVALRSGGANLVAPQFVVNDAAGAGATFAVTVVGGVATAVVPLTTGAGYTNPVGTWTDPGNPNAVFPVALPVVTNWVAFATDSAAFAGNGTDVGKVIRANGGMATIVQAVSTTSVIADVAPWAPFALQPNDPLGRPLPALPDTWSCTAPVTTVTGLDHLNGMPVSILADGSVLPAQTVVGGAVVLPAPATIVLIGLGYQCQLQTMNVDTGEPSIQGKRKKVGRLDVIMQDTRGLKAGPAPGPAVGPGGVGSSAPGLPSSPQLIELKDRTGAVNWNQPTPLLTGIHSDIVLPQWQVEGSVLLQQDYPLPATVLAVAPELVVGE